MFFGLTIEKLVLIGVIAALLVGPERLPRYAEALAGLTKRAREMLRGARSRVRDEMGDDFDEMDWRKLDPRQYDPRRIIREALLDDDPATSAAGTSAGTAAAGAAGAAGMASARPSGSGPVTFSAKSPPPYDVEAT